MRLWDVMPAQNEASAALLEGLRLARKQPRHLRQARELWWRRRQTICLDSQQSDMKTEEVVSPEECLAGGLDIASARFDPQRYRTILQLAG